MSNVIDLRLRRIAKKRRSNSWSWIAFSGFMKLAYGDNWHRHF